MTKDIRVVNKKATFEYFIEKKYECGLVLQGWEVKALRAGKGQLVDSYVIIKDNELWLLGSIITPLMTATHVDAIPDRTRKLLLNKAEIKKIIGSITQKGMTCIALQIYLKGNRFKCEIAIAKGKKLHDKRETIKQREWNISKNRVLRQGENV